MTRESDTGEDPHHLRDKIIGLGDLSIRKNYYPQLLEQIEELKRSKKELENRSAALLNILEDLEESRRVAEENLEKFHTMADFTYDWEYWQGPDGDLIYISPSCERLTGYPPEEFLNNPGLIDEIVHPDDSADYHAHLRRIATDPAVHSLDFRILRRDGTIRWIAHICRAVTTNDGRPRGRRVSNRDITGRKEAEDRVRLSEQRFYDIISHLPDATLVIDREGRVIAWNRAMEEMTGVAATDVIGKTDRAYSVPIYGEKRPLLIDFILRPDEDILEYYPKARKIDDRWISEQFIPGLYGGKGAHVWVISSPLYDTGGRITGAIESIRDVTERKEAEIARAESEQRLNDIINFLPDATFAINREGIVIAWNRAMEVLSGVSATVMLGKGNFEYGIPIYGQRRPLLLDLVLHDNEEARKEYPGIQKAGDKYIAELAIPTLYSGKGAYVWFIASPLYDTEGRITGAIESIRDVTDRKRAEDAVKKSGQEWQTTFNAITDAVFLLDDKNRIVRHNRACETFLQKSADEIDGRFCHEIMHGSGCPIAGCPFEEAKSTRQRESLELKIGDRWLIASTDPVISDDGIMTGCVHLLIDITERKNAENALNQARKKLNLLNAITFSDIQNSIFSLSGYLQLQKSLPANEQPLRFTEKEIGLVQAISDSLKYANIYQSLGLKTPVWHHVGQSFLLGISHLDISEVSRRLDIGELEIYADPMLENVFFALAENIIEHAGTATEYSLTYAETSEGLILAFEDNGPGVPRDLKEKIFEREYTRRKGLGLFLSREILSITGITIRETGEPGKGARFEMAVPKGMYRFAGSKHPCCK